MLFNHLFGKRRRAKKKKLAEELAMDDRKRLALWDQHLANYLQREQLSKHFSPGNVNNALQNFSETDKILQQIESLISPELIHVNDEEKLDEEILADLGKLKNYSEIEKICESIVGQRKKQKKILGLFHEIHYSLKTELHLIRLVRRKPSRELLIRLFQLIYHDEAMMYKMFRADGFKDESKIEHAEIVAIAKGILIEAELKERKETGDERFVREMVKMISNEMSEHAYRTLGENIYEEVLDKSGVRSANLDEVDKGIDALERLMTNDELLFKIVKGFRPKYPDKKIRLVIRAFKEAYNSGHFDRIDIK